MILFINTAFDKTVLALKKDKKIFIEEINEDIKISQKLVEQTDIILKKAGDKKTIVCVVHHPTPTEQERWENTDLNKNGVLPYCKKRIENSIKWFNGDRKIIFKEMECWVPDTK